MHCCPISMASCRKSYGRVVDNWLLCVCTLDNIGMATEIAWSLPKVDSTNVKLSKVKWTSIQGNTKIQFFGVEESLCRVQCLNILNNQFVVFTLYICSNRINCSICSICNVCSICSICSICVAGQSEAAQEETKSGQRWDVRGLQRKLIILTN